MLARSSSGRLPAVDRRCGSDPGRPLDQCSGCAPDRGRGAGSPAWCCSGRRSRSWRRSARRWPTVRRRPSLNSVSHARRCTVRGPVRRPQLAPTPCVPALSDHGRQAGPERRRAPLNLTTPAAEGDPRAGISASGPRGGGGEQPRGQEVLLELGPGWSARGGSAAASGRSVSGSRWSRTGLDGCASRVRPLPPPG